MRGGVRLERGGFLRVLKSGLWPAPPYSRILQGFHEGFARDLPGLPTGAFGALN
jgi:hypothetical protein